MRSRAAWCPAGMGIGLLILTAIAHGAQDAPKEPNPEKTIEVTVRVEKEKAVIRVRGEIIDTEKLVATLERYVRGGRDELLLDAAGDVPFAVVIKIQDDAKSAGIRKVHLLKKDRDRKKPAEPGTAADRRGMTAFRGSTALQPRWLLS